MKYLFTYLLMLLAINEAEAQQNLLSISGRQHSLLPLNVTGAQQSLYFVWNVSVNLPLRRSAIYLEKMKTTGQDQGSVLISGNMNQADSCILLNTVGMILDSSNVYITYTKAFYSSSSVQDTNFSIYFQRLDTNLNILVPEKKLYSASSFNQLNILPQSVGLTKLGNKIVCPYFMPTATNPGGNGLSKAMILDQNGVILINDTIPMKQAVINVGGGGGIGVTGSYALNDGNVLFMGYHFLTGTFSPFDFVVTDSNLRQIDTFKLKPYYVNEPPTIIQGDVTSGLQFVILPTGSWIAGSLMNYSNITYPNGARHTVLAKFSAQSRYSIDTTILFSGKDLPDIYHEGSNFPAICHNRLENRVYFADMAKQNSSAGCDGSNYLQIVTADTNLHNSWRKFVYSGNGNCFYVTGITPCIGQSGVWVAGYSFSPANADDTSKYNGFIFHLDANTTTSIIDPTGNFVIRDRFQIYPQPATDHIVCTDFLSKLSTITCYDMRGKIIAQRSVSGNNYTFYIDSIPLGLYLIRITTNDGEVYSQIIVRG